MIEKHHPKDDLLPVAEIERNWPISRPTVWRHVRAGRFPEPVQVGSRRYWRREDVVAFFTPRPAKRG